MSIDMIQAILEKDKGLLSINRTSFLTNEDKKFCCKLMCKFGSLETEGSDLAVTLQKLCSTYQCLEANIVKIEKGCPF